MAGLLGATVCCKSDQRRPPHHGWLGVASPAVGRWCDGGLAGCVDGRRSPCGARHAPSPHALGAGGGFVALRGDAQRDGVRRLERRRCPSSRRGPRGGEPWRRQRHCFGGSLRTAATRLAPRGLWERAEAGVGGGDPCVTAAGAPSARTPTWFSDAKRRLPRCSVRDRRGGASGGGHSTTSGASAASTRRKRPMAAGFTA